MFFKCLAAEFKCGVVGCATEKKMNVNKTLKVLNLSGCSFTSEHLTNALAWNCSLKKKYVFKPN